MGMQPNPQHPGIQSTPALPPRSPWSPQAMPTGMTPPPYHPVHHLCRNLLFLFMYSLGSIPSLLLRLIICNDLPICANSLFIVPFEVSHPFLSLGRYNYSVHSEQAWRWNGCWGKKVTYAWWDNRRFCCSFGTFSWRFAVLVHRGNLAVQILPTSRSRRASSRGTMDPSLDFRHNVRIQGNGLGRLELFKSQNY
jgi:hypothetical protein